MLLFLYLCGIMVKQFPEFIVDGTYNYSVYAEFFMEKIQHKTIIEGETVYEGLTLDQFYSFCDLSGIVDFCNSEDTVELQVALEKEGKNVDMFNMYFLASYIYKVIMTKQFFLLKPQIKDILRELPEIKKITFSCDKTKKVVSNSSVLIKAVLETLKEKEATDTSYEVEKVVHLDSISNNIILQSKFIDYLAHFMNQFFPGRRKKDALVSTTEQQLIMYLLNKCGLVYCQVTDSRYRQLKMYAKSAKTRSTFISYPDEEGNYHLIDADFIKYEDWYKKKIDWTNPQFKPLEEGALVNLPENTRIE